MMTRAFVSTRAVSWTALSVTTPLGLRPVTGPGIGFLAIFRTAEEALTEFPGCDVHEIFVPDSWLAKADPKRPASRGEA
jgi:hypothetical protein